LPLPLRFHKAILNFSEGERSKTSFDETTPEQSPLRECVERMPKVWYMGDCGYSRSAFAIGRPLFGRRCFRRNDGICEGLVHSRICVVLLLDIALGYQMSSHVLALELNSLVRVVWGSLARHSSSFPSSLLEWCAMQTGGLTQVVVQRYRSRVYYFLVVTTKLRRVRRASDVFEEM
jgi:hypothetical protein